jgi:hypothetical protein
MNACFTSLAALLLFCSTTPAAIIFVDVDPDLQFMAGRSLDLNLDGKIDLDLLALEGHEGPEGMEYHWSHSFAGGREGALVTLSRLSPGDTAGPSRDWGSVLRTTASEHRHGPDGFFRWMDGSPTDSTPTYFGIRFTDLRGDEHFGWVRYQMYDIRSDLTHKTRVLDFAYESQPDVPITIATIPAPAAGLGLVLGVLGVAARRRRVPHRDGRHLGGPLSPSRST